MRKIKLWSVILSSMVAYAVLSCAVEKEESLESIQKRQFEAYINVNGYQNSETIGDSIYIIKRSGTGVGEFPTDSTYAFVRYTAKTLTGDYLAYSYDSVARQLGTYKPSNFYGPYIWPVRTGYISDPLSDVVKNMRPGEKTVSIIPPWITTGSSSVAYSSSTDPVIYDIELQKVVKDIKEYQYSVLQQFSNKYFGGMDSLSLGFYFKKTLSSECEDTLADGSAIDVWYVGRMLDGSVFDTNIQDTAKKYDLYDPAQSYTSMSVLYYTDASKIEEEEELVLGFCKGLVSGGMTYGDRCFVFFDSELGYGSSGNLNDGDGIPPFYPISFEIWIEEND